MHSSKLYICSEVPHNNNVIFFPKIMSRYWKKKLSCSLVLSAVQDALTGTPSLGLFLLHWSICSYLPMNMRSLKLYSVLHFLIYYSICGGPTPLPGQGPLLFTGTKGAQTFNSVRNSLSRSQKIFPSGHRPSDFWKWREGIEVWPDTHLPSNSWL